METLKERFEEKCKDYNFHHKGVPCFNDALAKYSILLFIEQEIDRAVADERKRLASEMRGMKKGTNTYKSDEWDTAILHFNKALEKAASLVEDEK